MSDPQPSLRLSDIRRGRRFRADLGDVDALAESIRANGLLHPVVVTSDNVLVAGERRLAAVAALGWRRVPVRVVDPADLLTAERDENAVRKDFTPSEAAAIAAALRPIERAAAKERMSEAGKGGQIDQPSRSEDRIAAAVGMSRNTLAKATKVVEAAAADPALQPIVDAMDETGNVEAAHREVRRLLEAAAENIERTDPAAAEAARQARLSRAIRDHTRTQMYLEPADWADGMAEADVAAMHAHLVGVREWMKRWDAALDRPALRVVGGAS